MEGTEQQHAHLAALMDAYGLTGDARTAVTESYDVFRRFHGPFITSIAAQMLPDLQADADQGRVIVFLGRDGHSFAAATRALAPDFFAAHCREIVLSRVVAETALQDLERNRGASFPEVEGFRGTRGRVSEENITGSYRQLTAYLRGAGIPAGREGSRVTVVDSSFKGTVQELLSAAYERTDFQGHYAFLGAAPDDPRPERKHGYVVHLRAEQTGEGKGYPFDDLHPDAVWTFASKEPINVIEDSLNGPLDTPLGMTSAGPQQRPQREDPESFRGFNPLLVPERFRDPVTREAIKAAALLAVHDAAGERAPGQAEPDWLAHRMQERAEFTTAIRQWTERSEHVDPQLKTVLDSVVRRVDHPVYSKLQDHFAKQAITEQQAASVWMRMEEFPDRTARAKFVQETMQQATQNAAGAPTAGKPGPRRPDPSAARARSTTTRGRPAPTGHPDKPPGQSGPNHTPPEHRRGRSR
uniref:ABC transporter permease n=1 Tax=Streptomyces sp. NBC_00049 TaxID=2903617 RepID=A0AAU2JX82_9ACTN